MEMELSVLTFALLCLAGVSYARRRFGVLLASATAFFPVTFLATAALWWAYSPLMTVLFLTFTLGASLVFLTLYFIDVVFAPFSLEMTYATFLCWILCPLPVAANFVALCLRAVSVLG